MDTLSQNRAQLIESVETLPEELLAELDSFLKYLKFKASEPASKKVGNDFLLSIAGLGESQETDISERDEEILAQEIDPIRGWSTRAEEST